MLDKDINEKTILQASQEAGIAIDRVEVVTGKNEWVIHFKAADSEDDVRSSEMPRRVWEEEFHSFLEPQAGGMNIAFCWDLSLEEICRFFWKHIAADLCARVPLFCGCLEKADYRVEGFRLIIEAPNTGAQKLIESRCESIVEYFHAEFGLKLTVTCELVANAHDLALAQERAWERELADWVQQTGREAGGDKGSADGGADRSSHAAFHTAIGAGHTDGKGNAQASAKTKKTKANKKPQPASVLLGKAFAEAAQPVSSLRGKAEENSAVVAGQVLAKEHRVFNTGSSMLRFGLTDKTFSVPVKFFLKADQEVPDIKDGMWLKVRGAYRFDTFSAELTVLARDVMVYTPAAGGARADLAEEKRVELHLHSKMSDMDGISSVQSLVQRAGEWGHEAIAITDHGVVQAFPDAVAAAEKSGIKVILGMEGYLIDDRLEDWQKTAAKRYHIILLAQNAVGLRNLYKLVTMSHLDYFARRPRIPRSVLIENREGLLLGSACEAGELIQGIVRGVKREELLEIASFYDYLEIQPTGNNAFLVASGRVEDEEGLRGINRKVLSLGQELGLPVAATCDVHFLDPEDEVFRRILMAGSGFSDADKQSPLFLRTTEEMLEEFAYLGEEEAYRVVVRDPRRIAARIQAMKPFPDELFSPQIDGAEARIESLARARAAELYGDPLPVLVEGVLTKELTSIIGNGFSVLYLIAHLLVKKSNEDGYLVGSRGSVGSSLVATLTGITEVNPLPPHYRCPACLYSDFIEDGSVGSGADLPDKACPRCGRPLCKEGHDIPFETFLGFDGDKVPDIDLNFSGDYQSQAHKYTEEIFGKENVFRAGTISTLASKTAFGYVKNYLEEREMKANSMETARLIQGCEGVKKTTGQHPGGLMVLPKTCDVYDFTPLQRPANDMKSDVITTHFDYHSISGRLVKLDILGHDDPTVIKMLEDLTGVNAAGIALDDPSTLSLFSGVEALCPVEPLDVTMGTLGVPEFGTKFVRQMLEDLKPTSFSHLVQVSGLSHGTDVWLNNAQTIIKERQATVSEIVCCRDDIMTYLIRKGLEPILAFRIMESVRKGKGLWPEALEDMKAHEVPEWYIFSCQKIKYMFPKAHAVAYVTMAFRIAWFKINYPEAFYASFFTVRATDFDAELICQGLGACRRAAQGIAELGRKATSKENGLLGVLEVAMEMFCRGLTLRKVDLWVSTADKFLITSGGLLPPFSSLQGVGEAAAKNLVELRETREIHCVEDLKNFGLSKTVIEALRQHGCFEGLPESNQLSLF